MANTVVDYERELPEVAGRLAWKVPDKHLVKANEDSSGWQVVAGRRQSNLLLVPKLRNEVDKWRTLGYPKSSKVTRRLFEYWFEEDHLMPGFDKPFRYYFCQREAMETLAWLVEIANARDVLDTIDRFATKYQRDLLTSNLSVETRIDGSKILRRYVPELDREGIQEMPEDNLRRLAFKMATGSGKTWVMAMVVVWASLHKQLVEGSKLSTNFLIVAPNVIVFQRLARDFKSNKIFRELPLIPPEWQRNFSQTIFLRGENIEPRGTNNLVLLNIQQLYSNLERTSHSNPIDTLLGKKPSQNVLKSNRNSAMDCLGRLEDLIVLNDEAHHVHDNDLKWSQSLIELNKKVPSGLSLWLDYSATPKDQNGMYYPWTVCDYPLAQAVEDRIVKVPLIVTKEDDPDRPATDPDQVNQSNVVEKFAFWIHAAVRRWRVHINAGMQSVLFIMVEKNVYADKIGQFLSSSVGFDSSEILVIHTEPGGEIRKGDLERARLVARNIDQPENKIRIIVSVMMLREGWDVRSVSVVLGLRPFTSKAEILPEQVVGRGLRLMTGISPDKTQTLEVLGTRNLLRVLQEQLEAEGVGVVSTPRDPVVPVVIQPVRERLEYDIEVPLTRPDLARNYRKLVDFDLEKMEPIARDVELEKPFRMRLRMDSITPQSYVGNDEVPFSATSASGLLTRIVHITQAHAGLTSHFALLYSLVKKFVEEKCFGRPIDLKCHSVLSHLSRPELQDRIGEYLAKQISLLSVERRELEFENLNHLLSNTTPFSWRRDLPPLEARKTVFNFVATYNQFEREFAQFLDQAEDVTRFAALATTEQGASGTPFRINYLKPSGAIGYYYPDWLLVQDDCGNETNWIVETKGRVWEGTKEKDHAARDWCLRVTEASGKKWCYFRVNQSEFTNMVRTFKELVHAIELHV